MSGSSKLPGEACGLWFLPDAHGAEARVVAEVEVADYAAERASAVVSDCAKLGIELPAAELLDLMPAWSDLLA